MDLAQRIKSFAALGETLRTLLDEAPGPDHSSPINQLNNLIENQYKINPWFTPGNVRSALKAIADELTEDNLNIWTSTYPDLNIAKPPVKVAVIMAGNIPLVGFSDFVSVLISGNSILAKISSKDSELMISLSKILCDINPLFGERIEFTQGQVSGFDAVIATGSDNSSRYFEYYFGKYPNIIRKNRNSIAVLEGDETDEELELLGDDIFSYFGLGCRNVSKIYIPEGYDIFSKIKCWDHFSHVARHLKYGNNYDFNKAVYIVNKEKFSDTGYLLLKEDPGIASPVSVLYYEFYESKNDLSKTIESHKEKIQCIIGKHYIPFGQAQSPHLWDYADGIDTLDFLLKKKLAGIS